MVDVPELGIILSVGVNAETTGDAVDAFPLMIRVAGDIGTILPLVPSNRYGFLTEGIQ